MPEITVMHIAILAGSVAAGALIGGAVGAGAGYLTSEERKDD